MKHRFPCFHKIKDFSAIQYQFNTLSTNQQFEKKIDENATKTSNNGIQAQITRRSNKIRISKPQVSFQRDFILEHTEAYNFMIERYLQQMFEDISIGITGFNDHRLFPEKSLKYDEDNILERYLRSEDSLLGDKSAEIFMEVLISEEKLYEFLAYICCKSCDQVALQLIYLGNLAWKEYLKIQNQEFDYQELIDCAKNLAEPFCQIVKNQKSIRFFTLQNSFLKPTLNSFQKQQKIKEIINFFIVTVFLISSQYLQNPFYPAKIQNQLLKHQFFNNINAIDSDKAFSEDEDSDDFQIYLKGKKKVKITTSDIE